MKKIFLFSLSIALLFIAFHSCDNTKTAQEYLREEKKAIDRYITKNNISIVTDYLSAFKSGEKGFEANKYFKTDNGLYIHVVDSGNGNRVKFKDEVLVRFDYYRDVKAYVGGDTSVYRAYYTEFPIEFRYGIGNYNSYSCDGWTIPLSYLGEGAIIDLIIPSSLGSSADNSAYRPVFYKSLHYTKFN
jgi:FKBP-type peptidyl-prolyl cis-trans isomerase